jgi:hypothetical protein
MSKQYSGHAGWQVLNNKKDKKKEEKDAPALRLNRLR